MKNQFGKESFLYLKTKAIDGQTQLEDAYFTAPLKIAKPFYEDTGIMNVMVMSASAGVMEGDCYKFDIEIGRNSRVRIESQSYQKIHRMSLGHAEQHNSFILEEGAFLDYNPKPTIPFADSSYQSVTECRMSDGSALIYSEILASGRVKSGEAFCFNEYKSSIRIFYGKELIFLENQFLCPSEQDISGIGFFENYTHQASLGFFHAKVDDDLVDKLYGTLENLEDVQFGISKTKKYGLVVRLLGTSSDKLENVFGQVRKLLYEF